MIHMMRNRACSSSSSEGEDDDHCIRHGLAEMNTPDHPSAKTIFSTLGTTSCSTSTVNSSHAKRLTESEMNTPDHPSAKTIFSTRGTTSSSSTSTVNSSPAKRLTESEDDLIKSSPKLDREQGKSSEFSQRLDELQTKLSQTKLVLKDIKVSHSIRDGPRITSPDKTSQTKVDACDELPSEVSDARAKYNMLAQALEKSRSESEELQRERVEMATRLAMLEAEKVLPRSNGETEVASGLESTFGLHPRRHLSTGTSARADIKTKLFTNKDIEAEIASVSLKPELEERNGEIQDVQMEHKRALSSSMGDQQMLYKTETRTPETAAGLETGGLRQMEHKEALASGNTKHLHDQTKIRMPEVTAGSEKGGVSAASNDESGDEGTRSGTSSGWLKNFDLASGQFFYTPVKMTAIAAGEPQWELPQQGLIFTYTSAEHIRAAQEKDAHNVRVEKIQKFVLMIPLVFSGIYAFSFIVFGLYLEFEFSYFSHILYPPTEKLSLGTALASALHEAAVKTEGGGQMGL